MTTDPKVQMLLAHLKQTIIKFEAGYASLTEARAELHKVAANFQLETIPLPETYAAPAAEAEQKDTFEVALWPGTGDKMKASGIIDGTNYRVVLFESEKEGVLLQGSIVPADAPEGSKLSDISIGYANVKVLKDGSTMQLSLKFSQIDHWFNGKLERVVSDNPKAPAFKAAMTMASDTPKKSNALLNVLSQIEIPEAAKPPAADPFYGATEVQEVPPVQPAPNPLFATTPATPVAQPAPAAAPPNPLFAGAPTPIPSVNVPNWLLE